MRFDRKFTEGRIFFIAIFGTIKGPGKKPGRYQRKAGFMCYSKMPPNFLQLKRRREESLANKQPSNVTLFATVVYI